MKNDSSSETEEANESKSGSSPGWRWGGKGIKAAGSGKYANELDSTQNKFDEDVNKYREEHDGALPPAPKIISFRCSDPHTLKDASSIDTSNEPPIHVIDDPDWDQKLAEYQNRSKLKS